MIDFYKKSVTLTYMKALLVKWHFYWYKRHMNAGFAASDRGGEEKKVTHHMKRFFRHNRFLCRHAPEVLDAFIIEQLEKTFPGQNAAEIYKNSLTEKS